jgi:hypothetical protein
MVSESNQSEIESTEEPEQEVITGKPELSGEPEITETETPIVKAVLHFKNQLKEKYVLARFV